MFFLFIFLCIHIYLTYFMYLHIFKIYPHDITTIERKQRNRSPEFRWKSNQTPSCSLPPTKLMFSSVCVGSKIHFINTFYTENAGKNPMSVTTFYVVGNLFLPSNSWGIFFILTSPPLKNSCRP